MCQHSNRLGKIHKFMLPWFRMPLSCTVAAESLQPGLVSLWTSAAFLSITLTPVLSFHLTCFPLSDKAQQTKSRIPSFSFSHLYKHTGVAVEFSNNKKTCIGLKIKVKGVNHFSCIIYNVINISSKAELICEN